MQFQFLPSDTCNRKSDQIPSQYLFNLVYVLLEVIWLLKGIAAERDDKEPLQNLFIAFFEAEVECT